MPRFEESGRVLPPQHSEAQVKVLECNPHRIRVPRYQWPPRQKRANEDKATLPATCLRCGAVVLAEADPVPRNLQVVLYGPAEDPQGTVMEEGVVLDAEPQETQPRGGVIQDEPQSPPRGGGRIRA